MLARVVAIVFLVGLMVGASTLQQVIDLQSDDITAVSSIEDVDQTLNSVVPRPPRQEVAIDWPPDSLNTRTHTLTIFRPPRLAASR